MTATKTKIFLIYDSGINNLILNTYYLLPNFCPLNKFSPTRIQFYFLLHTFVTQYCINLLHTSVGQDGEAVNRAFIWF